MPEDLDDLREIWPRFIDLQTGDDLRDIVWTRTHQVTQRQEPHLPVIVVQIRDPVLLQMPIDCEAALVHRVELVRPDAIEHISNADGSVSTAGRR